LAAKRVTALAGSRDSVWVGTEEGLFYAQGGRLMRVEGTPGGSVLSLAADEDRAWAGFAGGVIEARGGKLERVVTEDLTATSLAVRAGEEVRAGELWIGTPEGAWRQTGARFEAERVARALPGRFGELIRWVTRDGSSAEGLLSEDWLSAEQEEMALKALGR
jgi:ligand-binding sensor domain-containing protein